VKQVIVIILVGLVAWQGYSHYEKRRNQDATAESEVGLDAEIQPVGAVARRQSDFRCDGRTYCSQMTSCAEATYVLKNCPNVKMDGDNDGVPCEQQWCR
jgi:hypothetical protein